LSEPDSVSPALSTSGSAKRTHLLAVCQPGYERIASAELGGISSDWEYCDGAARHPGVLVLDEPAGGWCFPWIIAPRAEDRTAGSVNALARSIANEFLDSLRGQRIQDPWPCLFRAAAVDGLAAHAAAVEAEVLRLIRDKVARVARLATPEAPRGPWEGRGLFAFFTEKNAASVAREFRLGGQRRMADDSAAPSRSYLKTEEAFIILGREPGTGETVVDLGAAPGGWSYSAAKRGATVLAIDNGPLKGGALNNPSIEHLRADAFAYEPKEVVDWLFCDLVDEPHHVWRLIQQWLENGRCRAFVMNLKFGRADPHELLERVRDPISGLPAWCGDSFRVRHLHHDREEFTCVGLCRARG
jgi:23S rRNA (cytidine2498-2'-O)-methyltransferase